MNLVAFKESLDESKKFLKNHKLLKANGIKVIYKDDVSSQFKKASQKDDYFNLYRVATQNFDYDILMYDDSIFQFSYGEATRENNIPNVRYSFLQNPQLFVSYEEYLEHLRQEGYIDEEDFNSIGDSFIEEYQQYLNEQQVNTSNTSIRFDVDANFHKPLIHSTAHFHFGHVTNVRVPCDKIITPLGFVLFILKHIYYNRWRDDLITSDFVKGMISVQKQGYKDLRELDESKWDIKEESELFLN